MVPISSRVSAPHRLTFIFVCLVVLLALTLVACGSQPLPTTFAAADQTHLAVISWQQSGQDLSGTWITWRTDTTAPLKTSLSGQVQNGTTVTLAAGGSVFQGNYKTGQLTLSGTSNEGQFQSSTWTPLSQRQANALSSAFLKQAALHRDLEQLQATLAHPPTDSDPYTYAGIVQNAQSYVTTLQSQHDQVMVLGNPCGTGALALFRAQYPPDSSMFTLSNVQLSQNTPLQNAQLVAKDSTLNVQLDAVQAAWQAAHTTPLPPVRVSLAWRVSQGSEAKTVNQGQTQLTTLQRLLSNDFTTMTSLQSQATTLGTDVNSLAQRNGC